MQKKLIVYAKDLRGRSTDAERILWANLRTKRLEGLKFRRQHPIGKYIADFVCLERRLVIELDGGQHAELESKEYDRERDNWNTLPFIPSPQGRGKQNGGYLISREGK